MANDLQVTARSGLTVKCCGDAHLSNLGVVAASERRFVFEINDSTRRFREQSWLLAMCSWESPSTARPPLPSAGSCVTVTLAGKIVQPDPPSGHRGDAAIGR